MTHREQYLAEQKRRERRPHGEFSGIKHSVEHHTDGKQMIYLCSACGALQNLELDDCHPQPRHGWNEKGEPHKA